MVTNLNKLKGKIVEKGYTESGFAKALGMCETTLSRKMKKEGYYFNTDETVLVANKLNLTIPEFLDIFYANKLESKSR